MYTLTARVFFCEWCVFVRACVTIPAWLSVSDGGQVPAFMTWLKLSVTVCSQREIHVIIKAVLSRLWRNILPTNKTKKNPKHFQIPVLSDSEHLLADLTRLHQIKASGVQRGLVWFKSESKYSVFSFGPLQKHSYRHITHDEMIKNKLVKLVFLVERKMNTSGFHFLSSVKQDYCWYNCNTGTVSYLGVLLLQKTK